MNETEKVSVLLQPEHTQQLQVTGRGDAKPYLVVPSADLHPVQNISANTILSIETRRRRSVVYVEIFRKGAEVCAHISPGQLSCKAYETVTQWLLEKLWRINIQKSVRNFDRDGRKRLCITEGKCSFLKIL